MTEPIHPTVNKAHMQTLYLVELILQNQQEQIPPLVQTLPPNEVMALLGASLIYAAEVLRDELGDDGALERIQQVRRHLGAHGIPFD